MTLLAILACATQSDDETTVQAFHDAKIIGVVTDDAGAPLPGVTVSLANGMTDVTDGLGMYRLDGLDPAQMVVSYDLPGYSRKFKNLNVAEGQRVTANVDMAPVGATFDFDPAVGGVFEHSSVRIDIPAGDLIDSMGMPYDGPATLELTGYDPLDYSAQTTGIPGPGDYFGLASDGRDGFLGTAGFFEATLRSPEGEYLNLGPDSPATVELDDPRQVLADDPDFDAALEDDDPLLWWFDPDLGTWVEEGTFTTVEDEDGNQLLTATVDHFSWWNADYWYYDSMSCESGTVVDNNGNPIEGATITLSSDYTYRGYFNDFYYSPHELSTTTDENGDWSIYPVSGNNPYYVLSVEYTLDNGETIVDLSSYTTGDHSQDEYNDWSWNGTCNTSPPVVLDTCLSGGDVRVAWNSANATSAASAVFYETGAVDCADGWGDAFELDLDAWSLVSTDTTPATVIPDFDAMGLEETLRARKTKIKESTGNVLHTMSEVESGGLYYTIGYQTSAADALESDGSYAFWARGHSSGISGYMTDFDAVVMAPAIEDLDVGSSSTEVELTWTAEAFDGGVYILITGADTAVVVRTEDDGAYTWDDEIAQVFDGEEGLSLVVYRVQQTDHENGDGDTVRVLATSYVTDSLASGLDCEGAI